MPTVTVASKLPHGLRLQLQRSFEINEAVMGGGSRKVKRHEHFGDVVVLNGAAVTNALGGEHPIIAGFALTHDVDAEFFNKWLEQNQDLDAVAKGFVFAAEKQTDVAAEAKEKKDELSGFEPTNPNRLPPEFKKNIATADVGG